MPEAPRMDPQLLPIEVPYLQHAVLSQNRVSMAPAPHTSNQADNALLAPQQRARKGQVPPLPKVPPHHETVLQVGEDQSIIE